MPVRTLRPRSLSLAIHAAAMTLALAGAAPALLAAEAPAASSARSYDIAPGPLGRTLSAFASDNGVSLAFDPALTEGRRSAALRGRYAPVCTACCWAAAWSCSSAATAATPWCRQPPMARWNCNPR